MKFKFDWFMKGMVIAVLIAFLWPEPGARGGWLHPELLTKLGIAVVFYLNGLSLSIAAMHDGLKRWRAHLLIQGATFLIFPLLGLLVLKLTGGFIPGDLQTGFFYLCALPSTVSSSVALTVAARGNVPVAVFNATLSSLIGVVLTPMWIALILGQSGQDFELMPVIVDLLKWLVLPLVAGLCSRPLLAAWASRHKKRLQIVDRLTILMLVYTSFADSVKEGIWSNYGPLVVIETILGAALFFTLAFWIIRLIARALKMPMEEEIAVMFCGSKKTLASGVPMAHLIFGTNPALGLILMPIMIYHPLQLAIGGVLAQRWGDRAKG